MGMVGSRPVTRHQREVLRIDRRWLLTWLASFFLSLGILASAYGIYKATGPHPQFRAFLRQLKHEARWLIPGLKGKPNAKDGRDVRIDVDGRRFVSIARPRA
jgi:hypothetical protein